MGCKIAELDVEGEILKKILRDGFNLLYEALIVYKGKPYLTLSMREHVAILEVKKAFMSKLLLYGSSTFRTVEEKENFRIIFLLLTGKELEEFGVNIREEKRE